MLPSLSRQMILSAIDRFDAEVRDTPEGQSWTANRAQKFALDHEGRLYPPKRIISLATGVSLSDFSGGTETNDALSNAGFEIVVLEHPAEEETHSIRESLSQVLGTYLQSRTKEKFGTQSSVWPHFKKLEQNITQFLNTLGQPDLFCYFGAGQGQFASVPWVGILDKRETDNSKRGVYCVYLFAADMSSVYLALTQGTSDAIAQVGRTEGRRMLNGRAVNLAERCLKLTESGFDRSPIDLRTDVATAIDYQQATILSKYYAAGDLPAEETIRSDLAVVIDAYEELLKSEIKAPNERKHWIFQANPDKYDIDVAVKSLTEITWLVNRYKTQIRVGDLCFLWRSGPEAGIIAVATVTTDPQPGEYLPEELEFIRESGAFSGPRVQVQLHLDRKLEVTLERSEIREDPRLSELQILKAPQGTNFPVSTAEAAALIELIDCVAGESNQSNEHSASRRRVWVIAPGRDASYWEEFYRDGVIAIGWNDLGDLSQYTDLEDFVSRIKMVYESEKDPVNNARACFDFRWQMQLGDLVFTQKGTRNIVGYGIISGPYEYQADRVGFKHIRKVEWKGRGEWQYGGKLPTKTLTNFTPYTALFVLEISHVMINSWRRCSRTLFGVSTAKNKTNSGSLVIECDGSPLQTTTSTWRFFPPWKLISRCDHHAGPSFWIANIIGRRFPFTIRLNTSVPGTCISSSLISVI